MMRIRGLGRGRWVWGTWLLPALGFAQSPPAAEFPDAGTEEATAAAPSARAQNDDSGWTPDAAPGGAVPSAEPGADTSAEPGDPTNPPVSDAPAASSSAEPGTRESGESEDPLAPPTSTPLSHERLAAWKGDFERAKQLLRLGRFSDAAPALERLATSAPSPADGAVARELAALAYHWHTHNAHLAAVEAPPPGDPSPVNTEPRRRSTGEIASLYVNSVVYGLGTGVWLAVLTEPNSPGEFFLPMLAVTGASVGAVAVADHGKGLHYGVPQSISSGMYIGFSQGLLWSLAHNAQAPYYDEWSDETVATVIWAGATAGAITGGIVGQNLGTTPGRAAWVGSTALWGGVLGGLTVGGAVPDDARTDERALLGAALFSSGGTIAGLMTAGAVSPSLARVRFIDLGGLAGGLLGLGFYATAADREFEPQAGLWSMNLGVAAGLTASWLLTSRMDPDDGEERGETAGQTPLHALLRARPTVLPASGGAQLGLVGSW